MDLRSKAAPNFSTTSADSKEDGTISGGTVQ